MTMRSYDDDDFRPWYVRDTKRYLKLSLEARGLIAELLRKWDRNGRLVLSADPVGDIAFLLRIDESSTRKAFDELTKPSDAYPVPRLVWDPSTHTLSDPDFLDRERRGKSAKRMAKKRLLDAAKAAAEAAANDSEPPPNASRDVTSVTSVTQRHFGHNPSPSSLVLSDLSEIRSEDPDSSPRADDEPTPWREGAGGMAARDRFVEAVSAATGESFVLERAGWHQSALCDLLNAKCRGRPKLEALDWLEDTVREWVTAEGGKSAAGWEPRALVRWVNGGRKSFARASGHDTGGERGSRWGPPKIAARKGGDS